jgi:hypothetical protein
MRAAIFAHLDAGGAVSIFAAVRNSLNRILGKW